MRGRPELTGGLHHRVTVICTTEASYGGGGRPEVRAIYAARTRRCEREALLSASSRLCGSGVQVTLAEGTPAPRRGTNRLRALRPDLAGAVGEGNARDFTALGDTVNTAARLTGLAGAGEILISAAAAVAAGLETDGLERRTLSYADGTKRSTLDLAAGRPG
jgi:class 3 adenylate cyclase